jgi:hypothetical protein
MEGMGKWCKARGSTVTMEEANQGEADSDWKIILKGDHASLRKMKTWVRGRYSQMKCSGPCIIGMIHVLQVLDPHIY